MTKHAFVVGHPIGHSRSPLIHGYWLKEFGIDGTYAPVEVLPEGFWDFLREVSRGRFVGGNVTIPHKLAACEHADVLTARARMIGAVNTLVVGTDGRLHGDNTDAGGFIAHLDQSLGDDWPGRGNGTAILLGAGGAARAIAVGLLERGLERIVVVNRTRARAELLTALDPARIVAAEWSDLPALLGEAALLVNTTSLGMKGQAPLEIDLGGLPGHAAVADIVYAPLETPLLAEARARGLRAVDGLGMLLHQAVPGFEAWFGVRPRVTPALHDLVVADLNAR